MVRGDKQKIDTRENELNSITKKEMHQKLKYDKPIYDQTKFVLPFKVRKSKTV